MQKLVIEGGKRLRGELALQGSKNSSLPIMAGAILTGGECVLENCPILTDIYSASRILNNLGCRCSFSGNTAVIDSLREQTAVRYPKNSCVRCARP